MTESPSENTHSQVPESELLDTIEQIVRTTKRAYGYQHLSTIGSGLRERYPDFDPRHYGYKKLVDLIDACPERFKLKWQSPARKSGSHIWVRLAAEPKRKEVYSTQEEEPKRPKPEPRLMTQKEFARLCDWLYGPQGCYFRPHPNDTNEMTWRCDGSLRKTRQWLRRRDFLSLNGNSKRLRALGARCDCEVLFNVQGRWHED